MEEEKIYFYVFNWKIENFSFTWHKEYECIESPKFEVFSGISPFLLKLYPRGTSIFKNFTSLFLELSSPCEGQHVHIDYELSILNTDGKPEYSAKENSCPFFKGRKCGFSNLVMREEIFQKKSILLPEDVLTLQCRIRQQRPQTIQGFAKTIIYLHRQRFMWPISNFLQSQKFSATYAIENADLCFILEEDSMYIQFTVNTDLDRVFHLRVGMLDSNLHSRFVINEYLLNREKGSIRRLLITRQDLLQKKASYLPEDCLKLQCEIIYSRRAECAYFQGVTYDEILTF